MLIAIAALFLLGRVLDFFDLGGALPSFKVGITQAQSSLRTESGTGGTRHAAFAGRRLVVFAEQPEHPLMRRIAAQIATRLNQSGLVEARGAGGKSSLVPDGTEGPELFLRLNLARLENRGLISRTTTAVVQASLGDAPWVSHLAPRETTEALLAFDWTGTLEVESTFTGFRTNPYEPLAQSIAGEFSTSISNRLYTASREHPVLPPLPPGFSGPYQPTESLEFLQAAKPAFVCSYYGFFAHNHTFWTLGAGPAPGELRQWSAAVTQAGWEAQQDLAAEPSYDYMSFRRGPARLEIFRPRRTDLGVRSPLPGQKPFGLVAHYSVPFSYPERERLLGSLLSPEVSVTTLLPFEVMFSREQRPQFVERLTSAPRLPVEACITVAEDLLYGGDTNAARKMLLRAQARASVADDQRQVEEKIQEAYKESGLSQRSLPRLTAEACRDAGFIEWTNGASLNLELPLGQPLLFFTEREPGVETVCYSLKPEAAGKVQWSLAQWADGGSSRMAGTATLTSLPAEHEFRLNGKDLRLGVRAVAGTDVLKFSLKQVGD